MFKCSSVQCSKFFKVKNMNFINSPKDILIEILTQLDTYDLFNVALTNKKIWQLCQTLKFWNRRITKLYGLSYWISDPITSFQDYERYIRPILYGRYERSHRYFRSLTKNKMRQLKLNDFQTGKSIYDEYYSKIPFGFKLIMIAGSRCQSWYWRRLCNRG